MIEWLTRGYFAANALLYGAIAIRTTLNPDAAAAAANLLPTSPAGRAEFLTVYAGQLLGLVSVFAVLALTPTAHRAGLWLAVLFYVSILAYRVLPPLLAPARYAFASGAIAVELALLGGAVALLALAGARAA